MLDRGFSNFFEQFIERSLCEKLVPKANHWPVYIYESYEGATIDQDRKILQTGQPIQITADLMRELLYSPEALTLFNKFLPLEGVQIVTQIENTRQGASPLLGEADWSACVPQSTRKGDVESTSSGALTYTPVGGPGASMRTPIHPTLSESFCFPSPLTTK